MIGLLAAFTVPAFQSIGRAQGVEAATGYLLQAMERVRQEAVSRQSPAWLVLRTTSVNGIPALQVGMVASIDGTTDTDQSNLDPIGRVQVIERVGLGDVSIADAVQLAGLGLGPSFSIGSSSFGNDPALLFTPAGEVSTNSNLGTDGGFTPVIAFSVRPALGESLSADDSNQIVVDGCTATATLKRTLQ